MFDRIVVGFDGSPTSRCAVDWAAQEARVRRASLEIAAALEEPWAGPDSVLPTAATRSIHAISRADLETELDRIAAHDPSLEVAGVTGQGSPAHLLRTRGRRADLIVVGTLGRPPAMPHELGATARALARRATAPVLVVPPHVRAVPPARVFATVDGSSRDADVLDAATREADLFGAELVLLHCSDSDETLEEATRILDAAKCVARPSARASLSTCHETQPLAAALAEGADHRTLAVVGQHRSTALTSTLFGSSAVDLVRAAALPVLVIPHGSKPSNSRA